MKTFFSFLVLLVSTVPSVGQTVTSNGTLYPPSNTDNYTITEITDQNKIVERLFTDKKTGKPVLKYLRKDDSTFVYTEYETNGKELRKGMLGQNKSKAMHYKIVKPDLEKDPEMKLGLVKDTIIYDDYFDKHGIWRETSIDNQIWEGYYDHELKTGLWKRIKTTDASIGSHPDSIIVYQQNTPIKDPYKSLSENELFELLNGKWFADTASSNKTYQFLHRSPIAGNETKYLGFNAPGDLTFEGIYNAKWSFKNNQLTINTGGRPSILAIIYLDAEMLVVQDLSN